MPDKVMRIVYRTNVDRSDIERILNDIRSGKAVRVNQRETGVSANLRSFFAGTYSAMYYTYSGLTGLSFQVLLSY